MVVDGSDREWWWWCRGGGQESGGEVQQTISKVLKTNEQTILVVANLFSS